MTTPEIPVLEKKAAEVDTFHVIWCSLADGRNDGSKYDTGQLQGATISTSTFSVPAGVTKVGDDKATRTIRGVNYAADTITTITLSGGTLGEEYLIKNSVVLSDGRQKEKSFYVKII